MLLALAGLSSAAMAQQKTHQLKPVTLESFSYTLNS